MLQKGSSHKRGILHWEYDTNPQSLWSNWIHMLKYSPKLQNKIMIGILCPILLHFLMKLKMDDTIIPFCVDGEHAGALRETTCSFANAIEARRDYRPMVKLYKTKLSYIGWEVVKVYFNRRKVKPKVVYCEPGIRETELKRILDWPQKPWMMYMSQSWCTMSLTRSSSFPFHTYL